MPRSYEVSCCLKARAEPARSIGIEDSAQTRVGPGVGRVVGSECTGTKYSVAGDLCLCSRAGLIDRRVQPTCS